MAEIHALVGEQRAWFSDDRTPLRRMQVSWHEDRGMVVLSLWQGDGCTGTFRMPVADAPKLIGFLADALDDAVGPCLAEVVDLDPAD